MLGDAWIRLEMLIEVTPLSLTDSRQSAKHRRAILSGALLSEEHPPTAIQLKLKLL